ncbi:response regulator [Ferruginibacter sp.]
MNNKIDLLFVEDNEDYIEFVKRALNNINKEIVLDYVTDGKDAIEYFEKKAAQPQGTAKLIIMDINLPGMNGIQVLRKIRTIPQLKYVPVVMFSSSSNADDIKKSYDCGANGYIVKPLGLRPLTETLQSIVDFWLARNYCCN